MTDFDDLAAARAAVKRFVAPHTTSIRQFYSLAGSDEDPGFSGVFKIQQDEEIGASEKAVRRLTTTFTCLESVLDAQDVKDNSADRQWAQAFLSAFAERALEHTNLWESEGSAWIYCRARSLGTLARYMPDGLMENGQINSAVRNLIKQMWTSRDSPAGAIGIRERTKPFEETEPQSGHPANAYLTYWTLFVTKRLAVLDANVVDDNDLLVKAASDWIRKTLGEQVAFHYARSPHADPQQLAWCIAGILLDVGDADLVSGSHIHDLLAEGLKVFFAEQSERGTWSRGKPLFNYKNAGNAYCYTYETLAELLALVTDDKVAGRSGMMKLLRPYWRQLVLALSNAEETALPLIGDPLAVGWGSNHHPHRPRPESWATASVFRFAQRLRRLIGRWTNDEAQRALGARPAKASREELAQRGGTWNLGFGSAGLQLATSYLLPLVADRVSAGRDSAQDPDDQVIAETSGRSAILYGPPGTGKTTLVEAIAGSLEWPFIEVNPAQFLDQGLDMVSARADLIFRQMMELDRCVVLIDEIDELVQNRTNDTEPLERFFTTTMLPRLAKLWSMGKIMFFANTNNVLGVDSAIRRGQRFDAAILVMPPGWESKVAILKKHGVVLKDEVLTRVNESMSHPGNTGNSENLRWFPLTRFDQMEALAMKMAAVSNTGDSAEAQAVNLSAALARISRDLLAQDWFNSRTAGANNDSVATDLDALREAQRRDAKLRVVVEFDGDIPGTSPIADGLYREVINLDEDDLDKWALTHHVHVDAGGLVTRSL